MVGSSSSSSSSSFGEVCAQEEQVASFAAEFERAKQRLAEMVVEEAETGGKGGEKLSVSFMAAELNGMLGTKLGVEVEKEAEEEEKLKQKQKNEGGEQRRPCT